MRSPWLTRRAIGLHVTLALSLPSFCALGIWQLHRALDGNSLSWAYTFEWPLFALYAIFMWWRLVHEQPGPDGASASDGAPAGGAALADGEDDPDLAAYNAYLRELHARDAAGGR